MTPRLAVLTDEELATTALRRAGRRAPADRAAPRGRQRRARGEHRALQAGPAAPRRLRDPPARRGADRSPSSAGAACGPSRPSRARRVARPVRPMPVGDGARPSHGLTTQLGYPVGPPTSWRERMAAVRAHATTMRVLVAVDADDRADRLDPRRTPPVAGGRRGRAVIAAWWSTSAHRSTGIGAGCWRPREAWARAAGATRHGLVRIAERRVTGRIGSTSARATCRLEDESRLREAARREGRARSIGPILTCDLRRARFP